jgi:2-polyprenyl-6-methoxyphenol hydroxylase-like FAD-dependent oxidoreductase
MTTTPKRVLISGAGIAGPALASWLTRYGIETTVVERAPTPRAGGYAVDFRGHVHLDVLDRMGVLDQVRAERTRMGDMYYVNAAGRRVARMPSEIISGDLEILRGDLARILYDATKDTTEYLFDDTVTALTETGSGVEVSFEHAPTRTFDVVVGADGLHSTVRTLTFGPSSRFVSHSGLHYAVFTTDNHLDLDHSGLLHVAPGRVAAVYSARNNTEAKVLLFFSSPPLAYQRGDLRRQRELVSEAFRDVGWEMPRLLTAMERADDLFLDPISQVHLDRWSRGRVALLGDAAYCPSPLSGMGSGLAVVGAYVLAGELATALRADPAGGAHRALGRYEQVMRQYVTGCQRMGEGLARWMVPQSRFMAWFVAQNYKVLPYLPWKGLIARGARRTASAIELPAYRVG